MQVIFLVNIINWLVIGSLVIVHLHEEASIEGNEMNDIREDDCIKFRIINYEMRQANSSLIMINSAISLLVLLVITGIIFHVKIFLDALGKKQLLLYGKKFQNHYTIKQSVKILASFVAFFMIVELLYFAYVTAEYFVMRDIEIESRLDI